MAKLQLYITKSTTGFKFVYNINPAEDIRSQITDVRDAVAQIDYDSAEKNIFYLIRPVHDGIFLVVLRTIPQRVADHLAAWIFIPANITITTDQLEAAVRITTRKVSGSEVNNDDIAALREAFAPDYPTVENAPAIVPGPRNAPFAWRLYGGDEAPSLHEFLGRGLWQQDYLPFTGVLLIDEELGILASGDDLTDLPLRRPAIILPPERSDDGFKPYAFGMLIDRPIRASLGADVTIAWKRPGFQDVTHTANISTPEFIPENVTTASSRKTITPNSFNVTSHSTRQPVTEYQVRVNGDEITPQGVSFTRAELAAASVVITADGFFPFSGHIDLASSTRALVQLEERRKIYVFEVPVNSELGAPIQFKINSKTPITDSPLDGYRLVDSNIVEGSTGTNHLEYIGSGMGSLLKKSMYAGVGLILGLLMALMITKCSGTTPQASTLAPAATTDSTAESLPPEVVNTPVPVVQAPETKPQTQPATVDTKLTMTDAIKYLDASKKWNRNEMEQNKELVGLYDDMNNMRLERLVHHWAPKLQASKNFQYVVDHAQKGIGKAKRKPLNPPYNKKQGDNTISIIGFANVVDP